jgi:hypothetical protein
MIPIGPIAKEIGKILYRSPVVKNLGQYIQKAAPQKPVLEKVVDASIAAMGAILTALGIKIVDKYLRDKN